MNPVLARLVALIFGALGVQAAAQGPLLGSPQNVSFPLANDLEPGAASVAIASDGRFIVAAAANDAFADVVISTVGEDGAVITSQSLLFPFGVGIHPVNVGFAMPDDGRFVVCHGDQVTADLVLIRRNTQGNWSAVLVDLPGGPPPLGRPPVVSPDGRWIATLGAGGAVDVIVTPVVTDGSGLPAAGTPVAVSLPAAANVPFQQDVGLVATPNGRAIAVPTTQVGQDLAIVTIPDGFPAAAPVVTGVDYPGSNGILDPSAPIAVDPGSRWFATHGQQVTGDVVVVALTASGFPLLAQNVVLPGQNNVRDVSRALAHGHDGRVIAVTGTVATGDVALVPIDAEGFVGVPVNVSYPGQNFVPINAPDVIVAATGRFAVTAGSDTVGDLVVTRIAYDAATNTVAGFPLNVPFGGQVNRRNVQDEIAVAPDGTAIAVYSGNGSDADLTVVGLDAFGTPVVATNVLFPLGNDAAPMHDAPLFSPTSGVLVGAGDDVLGDLIAVEIERGPSCFPVPGPVTTVTYAAANGNAFVYGPLRFAPSGQYVVGPGQSVGDLVVTPVSGARVFPLSPARIGTTLPLRFRAPSAPGAAYVAGVSVTRCPGIAVGDGRTIGIGYDPLLEYALTSGDPAFFRFQHVLDADGIAQGAMFLPPVPELRGLTLNFVFITLDQTDPTGVGEIAAPTSVVLL